MKVVKRPKKKKSLPVVSGKKIASLSPKDHLLQQMALRFLVDKSTNLTNVAKELKTTTSKLRSFFEDPMFIEQLDARIEMVHGIDKSFMMEQGQISLVHMYEELRRREILDEGKDFKGVETHQLHKMIMNTQKELRLDTPGAFTSKVGVADLGKLQDRYETSLSGKMHRMDKVAKKKKKKKVNEVSREE